MRQAVILAGGRGTRLHERLGGRPKPLVDIDGIPLLQRQIAGLQQGGFTHLLLLVNYAADQIRAFCNSAVPPDVHVTLVDDGVPRGTAGALLNAFDYLHERFLVVYGDTLFDIDVSYFWNDHLRAEADASLLLHPNDHPFDSDLVEVDEHTRIVALHAAPHDSTTWLPNLVNAAMYIFEREAIGFWRNASAPSDIARDLFPEMLRRGARLHGYVSFEYIKDIGTPKRLDRAIADLQAGVIARARRTAPQKAVFLDRDGTLNELRGHIAHADEFALAPGAGVAVKRLNDAEYRVVVVTNQPVLARGETTVAELRRIHYKMETLLSREGALIDRLYFCPHYPESGFPGEVLALKGACNCRKPEPGLIDQATIELNIDLTKSWLIGDSTSDIALAQRRGLRSILVRTGEAGRDNKYDATPDFVAYDLVDAVSLILDRWPVLSAAAIPIVGRCTPGSVVLIGGLAQSGKSSFASGLKLCLRQRNQAAVVVSLDNWLKGATQRNPGVLGRYDMAAAERAIATLIEDRSVACPAYDAMTRTSWPDLKRLNIGPGDVIIVEGCPALLSDGLRAMANLTIFVECSEQSRRERFASEYRYRGMTADEIEALFASREVDEHVIIRKSADEAEFSIFLPEAPGP
jgi:histidinol-phosphate phosphatase family protein